MIEAKKITFEDGIWVERDIDPQDFYAPPPPTMIPQAMYDDGVRQGISVRGFAAVPMLTIDGEVVKDPATGEARWISNIDGVGTIGENPE